MNHFHCLIIRTFTNNTKKGGASILKQSQSAIKEAAALLARGELVSFPTETVYGLGASINSERALANVFKAKGRPQTNPLIVHISDPNMIEDVADLTMISEENKALLFRLTETFWPGALTVVCKAQSLISPLITATTGYVGIRMPSNSISIDLVNELGVPIAGPSANRFGHVSPTRAEHVYQDFKNQDEAHVYILDGGPC